MSDTDKNQALAIVIEKLTEIVGNISQDGITESGEKSSGSVTPKVSIMDEKCKENIDISATQDQGNDTEVSAKSLSRGKDFDTPKDIAEVLEISMEQGGSPNQVVINLPVKVGSVSITNTEGLLKSLKQLDHGIEAAKERKDETGKAKDLYQCSKCEYSSHNKHYLKQHVDLVHTAERPFKCPLCDYAGKRSHSLKEHLVVHSPFRPFMCPFCSASFRKKGHLTNHIKLHASEQAVACSICKHFIANRNELSRHLRQAHVGCEVYLCHVCEYATTSESNIVNHMHTHGNPTVYCCSGCRFIGVHEEILKKHVQMHHNGEGSFTVSTSNHPVKSGPVVLLKCSECGFTTNEREVMKSHMYENHLICLTNKSGSVKVGNDMGQHLETSPPAAQKASNPNPSPIDDEMEDESTKVISENHNSRLNSGEEDELVNCPTNISACPENGDEEAQLLERSEPSKWQNTVLVKVSSREDGCTSEQISYVCTSCKYSCKEAMQFISHMLSHAPSTTGKKNQGQAAESTEESTEQGFIKDKLDGLYCCLICGYACDHQRTIKAHIWKHSGHKDINYPTFQNGPLSMYEDLSSNERQQSTKLCGTSLSTKNVGAKALQVLSAAAKENEVSSETVETTSKCEHAENWQPSSEVKSDYVISEIDDSGQSVFIKDETNVSDTSDEQAATKNSAPGRKRKILDQKQSEMDVSMPKLRILSLGGPALALDKPSLSSDDLGNSLKVSVDEPLSGSPHSPLVQGNGSNSSDVYLVGSKTAENIRVVGEEVIELEDTVEVVVETSDGKTESTNVNEQTVRMLSLLDKKDIACLDYQKDDCGNVDNSTLQINEQGISSSLLAVIEQFRKDSSPDQDKVDGKLYSYRKVDDFYVCCQCQQRSTSLADIEAHIKNHKLLAVGKSVPNPVLDEKHLPQGENESGSTGELKLMTSDECSESMQCFICENCEESFHTVNQLIEHKMKIMCWSKSRGCDESPEEKDCFRCNFCDFVGMSVRSVKSHMKRHWNDLKAKHHASKRLEVASSSDKKKYFVCERCTSVFSNILDLLAHNTSSCSATQMPRCSKCSFVASNMEFLKKHMYHHHSEDKIYKCEMCDFMSKSYSKIDNHIKKHIEPCDLHCSLCDFIATSVRSLKSHMKRHTNDQRFVRQPLEQYKCNMCGYICHHLPALKSHMWRHASESNYSYEKTNAVINAAIEDGTQPEETMEKSTDCTNSEPVSGSSQYSTVAVESDLGDSLIAFRCCHCFFETCIKKELNEHMKQHMDIIQKTMEVNNDLFCGTVAKDGTKEDVIGM